LWQIWTVDASDFSTANLVQIG